MGFDKFVERNQNPTAALRNSSAFAGSRFRFKLRFTKLKLMQFLFTVNVFDRRFSKILLIFVTPFHIRLQG